MSYKSADPYLQFCCPESSENQEIFETSLAASLDPNRLETLQCFLVLLRVTVDGFSRGNASGVIASAAQALGQGREIGSVQQEKCPCSS